MFSLLLKCQVLKTPRWGQDLYLQISVPQIQISAKRSCWSSIKQEQVEGIAIKAIEIGKCYGGKKTTAAT